MKDYCSPPGAYNCTYVLTEWGPGKARLNARKHGVFFADSVGCLEDERALTMRDPLLVHADIRQFNGERR